MAEWRIRNFVRDSDDDDEEEDGGSQGRQSPAHDAKELTEEGFIDIDGIADFDDLERVTGYPTFPREEGLQTGDVVAGRKAIGKETAKCITTEGDGGKPNDLDGGRIATVLSVQSHHAGYDDNNVDELQQDHPMTSHAAAQLPNKLSKTTEKEALLLDTSSPLQEPIGLSDTLTKSPVFPSSPPVLPSYQLSPVPSSPLSEPPPTPPAARSQEKAISASPVRRRNLGDQRHFTSPKVIIPLSKYSHGQNGVRTVRHNGVAEAVQQRPGRALRERNPIQLHPYALEGELYRQSLKARGLKPVRIVQTQEEEHVETDGYSQLQETSAVEDTCAIGHGKEPTDVLSSSPRSSGHWTDSQQPKELSKPDEDEGEFPDVDTILRQPLSGTLTQGFKRRKTAHTYGRSCQRSREIPKSPLHITTRSPVKEFERQTKCFGSVINIPPSPSLTSSSSPPRTLAPATDGFRYPIGLTSTQLPTPITSSEPKRRPLIQNQHKERPEDVNIESESESEETSAANSSSSEDEEAHQLQKVRRKIRGVLPASWLKLDLKTQSKKPINKTDVVRNIISPARKETYRGVARPITALKDKDGGDWRRAPAAIEISDDSTSDRDVIVRRPDKLLINETVDDLEDNIYTTFHTDLPDIMEDNRIDHMLPPKMRATSGRNKKTSRQTELTRSSKSPRNGNNSLFRKHRGSYAQQSSISDHVTKHSRELHDQLRYCPPRLGILDVMSPDRRGMRTAPPFVRLAIRTVRSRLDAGRDSPSRKFLRLATNQDTAEVQETLRSWRTGSMIPREYVHVTARERTRTPLTANSGNRQLPYERFDSFEKPNVDIRDSSLRKSKFPPIPNVPRKPRKTQTSLRTFLERHNARPSHKPTPKEIPGRVEPVKKTRRLQTQILSSLQDLTHSRPALLESYFEGNENAYAPKGLRSHFASTTHTGNDSKSHNPLLERFLKDSARPAIQIPKVCASAPNGKASISEIRYQLKEDITHRSRKRSPRYLDTKAASYRQYSEPVVLAEVIQSGAAPSSAATKDSTLLGLGPFGTQYTTSFDIVPLPTGIAFPSSTFLGSGQFSRSLIVTGSRDLELSTDPITFQHCHTTFNWGPWTDTVSSQLSSVIEQILKVIRNLQSQDLAGQAFVTNVQETVSLQQNIIHYFATGLSFLDPIDRTSCLQKCTGLFSMITCELDGLSARSVAASSKSIGTDTSTMKYGVQMSTRNLVMINQLRQIARHELVHSVMKDEIQSLVATSSRQILKLVFSKGFEDVRRFLRSCKDFADLDWEDQYRIESTVVIYCIVKDDSVLMATFWKTIQDCVMEFGHGQRRDARVLERMWLDLLTLLPLFELDAQGVLKTRQRYEEPCENWAFVKRLVEPVLEVYMLDSHGQSLIYNCYFRAISGRCFRLIKDWGWRRCEVIIGAFFDFYARNNLAHLQYEDCHGSPTFLEHLDENSVIELAKEDRCFHILLKIIAVGLRALRDLYPWKKIRDIAWRLMPNHGRNHPKDEAVRQEDLNALRNHHDLLCTLYWASPPGFRPRLSVIQNLVDVGSSHKEACHISIRAWSNLVRYQISTTEPVSSLDPFTVWHNDLIQETLRQHGTARTEVEAQAKAAESAGGQTIPHDVRETTIGRNQQQVESVLIDALVSLRNAVDLARGLDAARTLLTVSLSSVFDLFDAKQPRTDSVIVHALDVLIAFSSKFTPHEVNDDSQDFGDWSAFEDDSARHASEIAGRHIQETMLSPMSRLMSNCFGADVMLDDTLLLKLVQTWVAVAQISVAQGIKSWNDFLSPYAHDSWLALRDTEQTRKFTAYFLATLIEKEHGIYREYKTTFITSWVSSLLERESLLKFQHLLTEAILNADRGNPLLANLPFWADTATGRFAISAPDFRERRLSLISCVLSNMRESMDFSTYHNLDDAATQRHEYSDLLKRLMTIMKHNYQELGTGSSVRGAYVDFVHAVVGFLQQHTSDICPIDRFFTDSLAFPLPATDPTYVVGRLRNYQLRLQDSRTPKQVSVFIQTVSERAAVDGQQRYLVEQLRTAVSNTNEKGDPAKPTLRSFVLQSILPAYIQSSFGTTCGWLLAAPILQAAEGIFRDVIQDIDGTSEASVDSVGYSITVVLEAIRRSLGLLVDHSGLLEQPTVLRILGLCFSATVALLPTLSYLSRLPLSPHRTIPSIRSIKSFALFAVAILSGSDDLQSPPYDEDEIKLATREDQLAKTRSFTANELQDTLRKNWTLHDGHYYVIRGNLRREVVAEIGSFEEERGSFLAEAQRFFEALCCFPALDDDENDGREKPRRPRWSGAECIF
ncbi:MAG: hypothetical protein Q9187_002124 [Circinaria calcarea]